MVVVLAACFSLAVAYEHGDLVTMTKRTQYAAQRTHWNPVLAELAPRFGVSREVILKMPKPAWLASTQELKVQFSFADAALTTSWLTLADGSATTFAGRIEVTFYSQDGNIHSIDVKTSMIKQESAPKDLHIMYVWEDVRSEHPTWGMHVLLFGMVTTVGFAIILTIWRTISDKGAMKMMSDFLDGSFDVLGLGSSQDTHKAKREDAPRNRVGEKKNSLTKGGRASASGRKTAERERYTGREENLWMTHNGYAGVGAALF